MPPFDSILGWGGSPTDSERTLSKSEESMKSLATDPGEPDEDQDPHSTDECYRQHDRSHAAQQARDNSDSTTASRLPEGRPGSSPCHHSQRPTPHATAARRSTKPTGTTESPGCRGSRGRKHQPHHAAAEPTSWPQTTKNRPEQAVFNPKTHV